jgi:hypothetical protein
MFLDLRTTTKETGFLPNLRAETKYFAEKPGFWPSRVSRSSCLVP